MRRSRHIVTLVATVFTAGLITQPTFPAVRQPDPVSPDAVSWPAGPHAVAFGTFKGPGGPPDPGPVG